MTGRARILMVGDSLQDLRIHAATLNRRGFDVVTAHDVTEVQGVLDFQTPDLILVEARMKGVDGFELCRQIKGRENLANIPVIFITDSRTPEEVDKVYAAGGVDFILKPCPLSEFLARIQTQINLHNLLLKVEHLQAIAIDANPLTHLPGNNTIVLTIQEAIDADSDVALIYTDLDNFKSYNDAYGFSAGDDVLLFNANTLQDVLLQVCGEEGFLGHIGGDDFVLMVPARHLYEVGDRIVQVFDEGIPEFYSEEDQQRGYIMAKDRNGGVRRHPLVAISLAGIILRTKDFTRYVEVATACAELKKEAKAQEGSFLFVDRRATVKR
jgi:diguanylate cyclase (GGDEF)-like protein